ncbi:MAG: response regulator [Nitrospirae bacterium]|nr:MAG: response regulator [Nitrospirota bacterium]
MMVPWHAHSAFDRAIEVMEPQVNICRRMTMGFPHSFDLRTRALGAWLRSLFHVDPALLVVSRTRPIDHESCLEGPAPVAPPHVPRRMLHAAYHLLACAANTSSLDPPPPCENGMKKMDSDSSSPRPHILVVDDDAMVACVTAELLAALDYEVTTVASGKEAIAYCRACLTPIDLVILDLLMPDMDGTICFAQLRKIHPSLNVLISTGSDDDDRAVNELLQRGAIGVIQKPFDIHELSHAVGRVLGRRTISCASFVPPPSSSRQVN